METILEIVGISKQYDVVQALKDVSFSIRRGEVHTLLGENGAGKSTLIKIISGKETPSAGRIVMEGEPVKAYHPRAATALGIAMVHQELAVFDNVTVAENIFPNSDRFIRHGFVDRKAMYRAAEEMIRLFGMDVQPGQKMESLTLAQQQMVEILRCISTGQKIILLDEPTSGLNAEETDKLMQIIAHLKEQGIAIIYISHRINEIIHVSDRITVLKDGRYVGTYDNTPDMTEQFLISRMVGTELSGSLYAMRTDTQARHENVVLEAKHLNKGKTVLDVSFQLYEGEVLGFFGLEGSGTGTVSRILYGLEGKDSGEVSYRGEPIRRLAPPVMVKKRISYLNNNRKTAGLLLDSPAVDNISMPMLREMCDGLFLNMRKMVQHTLQFIHTFAINIPSVWQKPRNLSGGNQQKLMFSMCLTRDPELMIINEPTRGIDVGTKAEIHKCILEQIKQGMSVLIFSNEMPELLSLCDRIVVMHEGRIFAELGRDEMSEPVIMAAASGIDRGESA